MFQWSNQALCTLAIAICFGSGPAHASDVCQKALTASGIDGLLKSVAGLLPADNILDEKDLAKLRQIIVSNFAGINGAIVDVVFLSALVSRDMQAYPEYKRINLYLSPGIDYDPTEVGKDDWSEVLNGNLNVSGRSFPSFAEILESDRLFSFIEIWCYVAD